MSSTYAARVADKKQLRVATPYQPSAVPVIVIGTIAWGVALLVLLVTGTHTWWRWVCLAGFSLGVIGVPIMARYQRVHG